MGTELANTNSSIIRSVDDLSRIGKMMAMSGYFTDARDVAQASVKVMAGMEMGFGAFASMTGIYIIQGKPSVGANLMASAVKSNPRYDYRIREITEEKCSIEFFEMIDGRRESIGISSFTIAEARKAGVKNLDKYARNMLFARAMSNGIKWFCPDVFSGSPTYTPEELGADVDGDGNPIEVLPPEPQYIVEATETHSNEVLEATPTTNAPVEQKPVEAPQKPSDEFDENAFVRGWKHRVGLPPLTLEEACQMKDSKGHEYGTMGVKQIYYMLNAIEKKLPTVSGDLKDHYMFKLSAINEIMTAKNSALAELEKKQDPFVKGA